MSDRTDDRICILMSRVMVARIIAVLLMSLMIIAEACVTPSATTGPAARLYSITGPSCSISLARGLSKFSYQIAAVAVGWQVYALTNSALALGLVGLTQFVPTAILVFVAGHAADRYDRKRVAQLSQFAAAAAAAFLAWGSFAGWLGVGEIFVAVTVFGAAIAFENPAAAAMLPLTVPDGMLQRASAQSSVAVQIATIAGPAVGGFAYALGPDVPYGAMAVLWLAAGLINGAVALRRRPSARNRRRSPACSPASASCATIPPFLAPSRSICSRCCSAASPRCCRSMRATSCTPGRGAWACCAARRRSAPC